MNRLSNVSAKSNELQPNAQTDVFAAHLLLLKPNSINLKLTVAFIAFLLLTSFISVNAQIIQLHYPGKNEKIIVAVKAANKILSNPDFYKRIDTIKWFDNSTFTGLQISNEIKNLRRTIEVEDYWNPLGIANAKTVSVVRLNKAKLGSNNASITNTVIHETIHAVDWWTNKEWDYTHDGNSPKGQDNTAPWVIGAIAESMVK